MNKYWFRGLALLISTGVAPALADGDYGKPEDGRGQPPQPPAAAFSACTGKSAGDSVTITTVDGHAMSARCEKFGDRLAARPEQPPPGGGHPPDQPPDQS